MKKRRLYPWKKWLAAGRVVLRRGRDFDCSIISMAQAVRNKVSALGLGVSIEETSSGLLVEIVERRNQRA